ALVFFWTRSSRVFGGISTMRALRCLRSVRSKSCHESINERALAGPGRAGDANQVGAAGAAEDRSHQLGARGILVLDQRDGARGGARVAGQHALAQRRRHAATKRAEPAALAETAVHGPVSFVAMPIIETAAGAR